MSIEVKKVEYFYAIVDNKPGEAQKLLEFLSAHSVNMLAFTAFPVLEQKSQLDFFPQDIGKLQLAASEAGINLTGPKKAFLIQGAEKAGVLTEFHLKLSNAGINVAAANGVSSGQGRFGYILWVHPEDYEKASQTLQAE